MMRRIVPRQLISRSVIIIVILYEGEPHTLLAWITCTYHMDSTLSRTYMYREPLTYALEEWITDTIFILAVITLKPSRMLYCSCIDVYYATFLL